MSFPDWTDRAGVRHVLRPAHDLSATERRQLDLLRQQVRYAVAILGSGLTAPVISDAPLHMARMMLRILLPQVAEQEIATFDAAAGQELLTRWWSAADATG